VRGNSSKFYFKHVDDKGIISWNENYYMIGIIDWQFTRTVPVCDTLGLLLITASLDKLCSKDSVLTADDIVLPRQFKMKGSVDLAKYMGVDELARRYIFGLVSRLYRIEGSGVLEGLPKACVYACTDIGGWIAKEVDVCKTILVVTRSKP
jgi:hypothetical protein